MEERNAFRALDEDNGQRPDITIFNLPNYTGNYYLDVRITSPLPPNGGQLTLTAANKRFRAGNESFKDKMRDYQIATTHNLGFLPTIFETTGQMHPETESFFGSCLNHASTVRKIPFPVLWKFWMSSIMFSLQRSMAEGIIGRNFEIYGRQYQETGETSTEMIRNFGRMSCK